MKQFLKEFYVEGVFDPKTVQILSGAFDDAWKAVESSGAPFAAVQYRQLARETLAKHIIQLAKAGERDQQLLTQEALLKLGRTHLR